MHNDLYIVLILQAGGSSGLLMDLAANEKSVHADFFNGKDLFIYLFVYLLLLLFKVYAYTL